MELLEQLNNLLKRSKIGISDIISDALRRRGCDITWNSHWVVTVGNDWKCCEKMKKTKNLPAILPPSLSVCLDVCLMALSKTTTDKKTKNKTKHNCTVFFFMLHFLAACAMTYISWRFLPEGVNRRLNILFSGNTDFFFCIINHGVAFENLFHWKKKKKKTVNPEQQVPVPLTVGSTDTDVSVLQQSLAISPIRTFYNCSLA